jgi:hypothetical protein
MAASTTLHAIELGVDLLEALAELGRGGEGWVNATGLVEGVELRVAGEGANSGRTLTGTLNLLQLSGPLGGPFSVTLARASDAGIDVLGGVLVRARSAGVSLVVNTSDKALPAAAARLAPRAERPRAEAPTAEAGGVVWATAAMASARAARARDATEGEDEILPEAGDLVDHFAFGRSEVLTSDGDRLRIRDLEGPQRIREVSLAMLKVTGPTEVNGKRLYQLARRAPG